MNKKFITPLPSGGVPIVTEDFLMIQNELHEAINALCIGVDTAFVVAGCTPTTSGATLTITSGSVFVDGQVMSFAGYTGAYPVYIKAGTTTTEQRIFKDGFSKNALTQTIAVATTGVPSVGTYVTFNPQPNKTFKTAVTADVAAKVTQEIADRTAGDTTINTRISNEVSTLNTAIGTKLTKLNDTWHDVTYHAGSQQFGSNPIQYKKTSDGMVIIRGDMQVTTTTGGGYASFTLPVGYRPSKDTTFVTINTSGTIGANGKVMPYTASSGVWTMDIIFLAEQ